MTALRYWLNPRTWAAELTYAAWQVGLGHYCRIHDTCTWWPLHRRCARRDHEASDQLRRTVLASPAVMAAMEERAARVRAEAEAELLRLLGRHPTDEATLRKDRP